MLAIRECGKFDGLGDLLKQATEADETLLVEITRGVCRRLTSAGNGSDLLRLERLVHAGAWADAALTLIRIELPFWQIRRLAYDEGEWHCALSRERELPDWLDDAIESHHANLALSILMAFVEARRLGESMPSTSVPVVRQTSLDLSDTLLAENFS